LEIIFFVPFQNHKSISLDLENQWEILQVKKRISRILNLKPDNILIAHKGKTLEDEILIGELALNKHDVLSVAPSDISCAIDETALVEEYRFIKEQFPLVKMEDLLTYKGRIRCERGYVKELADRGIWPFTEYVTWHEFKMVLSYLHPYKPPSVTWLTDISHPNIIPKKKGKVCVSMLGKKWLPNTKLAAVINALYFLLSDPNPYSAYPNKRCKEVAKICRMFGFPLKRRQVAKILPQPKLV
jgi:hypothetical protein